MKPIFVEGISFKPHCAIGFTMCINQQKQARRPLINDAVGKLSRKARAKMVNAINWMVYLSQNQKYYSKKTKQMHALKLNFITLTLCAEQFHSDEYIKKHMLEPFLKWIKRKGNKLYVWRAETQANGNLHFHITSNKYIHYTSIRNKWNSLLQKHGYMKKFLEKNGHQDPNSTDVKGVKNAYKMAAYMVKYMSKKTEGRREVTCKVWSCSTALMNKRRSVTELDDYFNKFSKYLQEHSEQKQMEGYTLFFYDSVNTRNILLEEQLYHDAYKELNLWNEKSYCKRVPIELGRTRPEDKIERQLYVPTLWSETKRHEERQKKVLPCNYFSSTQRP